MTGYRPMTLANLADRLGRTGDGKVRWKLVWEFLEEYRWEPDVIQPSLLRDEPSPVGDQRWDTLLAALAEHLAAQHDLAPPLVRTPCSAAAVVPGGAVDPAGRRPCVGPGGVPQAWRVFVGQGPGGRVSRADDVLLGRAELERAFTHLGASLPGTSKTTGPNA